MKNTKINLQSIDNAIELSRTNKKLTANYQRIRQALTELMEATCNSPELTELQKKALDKAIIALQYKA
jgi:hypothetical protein